MCTWYLAICGNEACGVFGQAYGQTTYLITTLQRVPRGTEGAVSTEGTLAGAVAAVGFATIAAALQQVNMIAYWLQSTVHLRVLLKSAVKPQRYV